MLPATFLCTYIFFNFLSSASGYFNENENENIAAIRYGKVYWWKTEKRQVNDLCVHEYQRRSLLRFCNKILVYFASNKEKTKNWL